MEPAKGTAQETPTASEQSISKGSFYGWLFNVTDNTATESNISWFSKIVGSYTATLSRSYAGAISLTVSCLGLKLNPNSFEKAVEEGKYPEGADVQKMLEEILDKGFIHQFLSVIETIHKNCPKQYKVLYPLLFPLLLEAGTIHPAEDGFTNQSAGLLIKMIEDKAILASCLRAACSFEYPDIACTLLDQVELEDENTKEAAISLFHTLINQEMEQKMEKVIATFGRKFVEAALVKRARSNPVYNFVIGAERLVKNLPSETRQIKEEWLREYRRNKYQHIPGKAPFQPGPTEWFPSALQTTLWLSSISSSKQKEEAKFDTVMLAVQTSDTSTTRPEKEFCFKNIRKALDYPSSKGINTILYHFLDFFTPRSERGPIEEPQWQLIDKLFEMLEKENKEVWQPLYERIFSSLLVLPHKGSEVARKSEDLAIWLIKKHLVRGSKKLSLMGCHPLQLAIRSQYWELTRLILRNDKINVLEKDDEEHTAFYYLDWQRDEAEFNPNASVKEINALAELMATRLPEEKRWGSDRAQFEKIVDKEKKERRSIREVKEWQAAFEEGILPPTQAIRLLPDLMLQEYKKMIQAIKNQRQMLFD